MANNIEKQLKEISERLEQGVKEIFTSERYTEYLNTMSKFHNYSFNNTLLITMQKPEATLVAGYQAWQKKFNRHVKRGEKGIQIIAPAPIREKQEIEKIDPVTKEPVIGDDGQPETEIVEMVIPRFRVTTVFDVSQTEGEPIAELEVSELTGSVQFYDTFMEALQNISPGPIHMMEIEGEAKGYYHQTEKYIAIQEDGTVKSSFSKFMTEEEMNNLIAAMNGEAGDLLLFAADKNKVVWDVLGNLRLELAKQMELLDKNQYNFLWVTEFPLLEWSDEQNRYLAMHHPFTMPMEEDLQYIDSEPGRVRAKAYDIVLNGNEIGGGSVRIFQNDVQEKMFEVLGFTKEQAYEQFGFLLDAFKYGVPPHAGLAYGLDRMVMLMAKEDSIRDVIAFPKVKDASDLMTEAPSGVDQKQLDELCLAITKKEERETFLV